MALMGESDLTCHFGPLLLCLHLQSLTLIFNLSDHILLEFFLCSLTHGLRIVIEVLVARVFVRFLSGLLVMPVLFSFLIYASLITCQLSLLQLILK